MIRIFLTFFLIFTFFLAVDAQSEPYTREKIWEKDIAAFLDVDLRQTPPSNAVLFTGSSSIRMWTSLRSDFPKLNVINRGFGGSQLNDLVFFAPKIVIPYKPKKIVIYSGENDIEAGRSPEDVLADFQAFLAIRDKHLAGTPVIYISMKPSILRWAIWPNMEKTNSLIKTEAAKHKKVTFVDISTAMLGTDGKPPADLFISDGLHLSRKGYDLWREILAPHLR
ncbi:MAG: hypothetical protein KF685_04760 [Acidobacteria bacterium]|nr:hypothetical protein [Acidobacteriota bacterium]